MTLDTSIVRSASTFGPMQTDWETRIDMDRLRTQRLQKTRAPAGGKLPSDFLGGAFDAAIMGNELPDDPALAPSLELAGRYAYDQGLTSRLISADEIRSKTEGLAGACLGGLGA
jgi:hypothetical protein